MALSRAISKSCVTLSNKLSSLDNCVGVCGFLLFLSSFHEKKYFSGFLMKSWLCLVGILIRNQKPSICSRLMLFEPFSGKLGGNTESDLLLVYLWEVLHLQCFLLALLESHVVVNLSLQNFSFLYLHVTLVYLIPSSF